MITPIKRGIADQYNFNFSRPSTALDRRGRLYMPNNARFENGGVMVEEGTTPLIPSNLSNTFANLTGLTLLNGATASQDNTVLYQGKPTLKVTTTSQLISGIQLPNLPTSGVLSGRWIIKGEANSKICIQLTNLVYSVTLSGGWDEIKKENIAATATTVNAIFTGYNASPLAPQTFWLAWATVEQKSYCTSLADSVRAPEVLTIATNDGVQRKNLLDISSIIGTGITVSGDKLTATGTSAYYCEAQNYIPVNPSTNCTFSGVQTVISSAVNRFISVMFYDSSKTLISESGIPPLASGPFALSFTTPSNAAYVHFRFARSGALGDFQVEYTNLQLELGSVATSFQPYGARLAPSEGTIEIVVDCTNQINNGRIIDIKKAVDNSTGFIMYWGSNYLTAYVKNDANVQNSIVSANFTNISGIHRIGLKYSTTEFSLWVDGVKKSTAANPLLPSAFKPLCLGSTDTAANFANTIFYDLCFSNVARTDTDIAQRAAYAQANRRFPDDANVTWHSNFDRPDAQRALRSIVL